MRETRWVDFRFQWISEYSRPHVFWCIIVISLLFLAVLVLLLFSVAPQGQHHAGTIHHHQKTSKGGSCSIGACQLAVHPGETLAGIDPLSCSASVCGIDLQGCVEVNADAHSRTPSLDYRKWYITSQRLKGSWNATSADTCAPGEV